MSKLFPGLKFFNLTTPEKVTIKTLDLPDYDSEFYHASAKKIQFIIPTKGPTIEHTANSTFPRCELRETLEDGTLAWWTPELFELNWLEYTVSVDDPGYEGNVIIGQIHGKGDNPPIKIQYNDQDKNGVGRIVFQSREYLGGKEIKEDILTDVKPGDKLTIRISLNSKYLLTVTINGTEFSRQLNRQSYKDDRFYFKIGGYVQTVVNSADSTGLVNLYSLDLYHGAAEVVTPPVEPEPEQPTEAELIGQELEAIETQYKLALIDLTTAKTRLNAASTRIKALTDAAERLALNTQAAEVKKALV
uniref:Alginate lyase 2 domain-containing protein n=1 Tax=Pseudomonas phage Nican01 TaxID=3138540 RepID=A0AAU6W096_9CAUD